jgi:hypothetical protein
MDLVAGSTAPDGKELAVGLTQVCFRTFDVCCLPKKLFFRRRRCPLFAYCVCVCVITSLCKGIVPFRGGGAALPHGSALFVYLFIVPYTWPGKTRPTRALRFVVASAENSVPKDLIPALNFLRSVPTDSMPSIPIHSMHSILECARIHMPKVPYGTA